MKRFKNRRNRTHHAEITFDVKHTPFYQILQTQYKYTGVAQTFSMKNNFNSERLIRAS